MFAVRWGRPAGARNGRADTPRSATNGTSVSGTWTKKMDSHAERLSVRTPPARRTKGGAEHAGGHPNAGPPEPPFPVVSNKRPRAATTTKAAPAAWNERATTSTSNDGASPQARDDAANTIAPETNVLRGRRRATYAAGTARSASTRLNNVGAQATVATPTSNWDRISGSASVTIEESASASPIARPSSPERMRPV